MSYCVKRDKKNLVTTLEAIMPSIYMGSKNSKQDRTCHLRKACKTSLCSSCLNDNSNPYTAGFHSTTQCMKQIINNLLYR